MASNPTQSSKSKKRVGTLMAIGASLMIALAVIFGTQFIPASETAPSLPTVQVTRGDIARLVPATGRVVPNFEVEIKAKGSGKILKMPYDVSDYVKEGELLVQLDPIDENRQVSQASASLTGMESRMTQTRLNLNVARQNLATDISRAQADLRAAEIKAKEAKAKKQRLETLIQNRYISQEEYDIGMTEAVQAASALANAKVRLRELQTQELALKAQAKDIQIAAADVQGQRVALATSQQRLLETKIYAPISGVVTSRLGQIGQIVSSGISNVGGGTAILMLADLSRIFVLASVDESDIGLVREGQVVRVTADSYPGQTFEGKVVQIAPKGFIEANVVTFEVKIEISGANKNLLKPEMTANVEIVIDEKENVLLLPADAVQKKGKKQMVQILSQTSGQKKAEQQNKNTGSPREVTVETGLDNGSEVEILSGLKEGDTVLLGQTEQQSRWRKDGNSGANKNSRGQMMMMRGMRGGRR